MDQDQEKQIEHAREVLKSLIEREMLLRETLEDTARIMSALVDRMYEALINSEHHD
jgi:hypothetical protein